jgi:ATP-dependent Lon protease
MELMPPMSAESTVSRNYLDWLLAVLEETLQRDS